MPIHIVTGQFAENMMRHLSVRIALSAIAAFMVLASSPLVAHSADAALTAMPKDLEVRFALSALPPKLRPAAAVYVLDPAIGYRLARPGTSGLACLVERTAWELGTDRDDIYIPLCYDASGLPGHFKAIIDAAALRAHGMSALGIKAEISKRYEQHYYHTPMRAGLSYMEAPIMRTKSKPDFEIIRDHGPTDWEVHTMAMPHIMIYASGVTNADIGAVPDLAHPESLSQPFIDTQGNGEQSYIIQVVGATEKKKILEDEKDLVKDLCDYREVLCLEHDNHNMN